jgi:Protein of unknown function (DUF1592)/Protein of unknown function (DUF1588)/Protein of unknown function (DUF1587)/Protein of unknown function (DUF1585)/Protein of unknown function (DUF1595)/Planctomycete cytochrome C
VSPELQILETQMTQARNNFSRGFHFVLESVQAALRVLAAIFMMTACFKPSFAADQFQEELEHRLTRTVLPLLKDFCFDCHGATKQEGMLKLSDDTTLQAIAKNYRAWEIVLQRLRAEEMPPKDASKQPSSDERRAIIEWIQSFRDDEADRHSGDPGTVLARRLSNTEFDYSIRDLTGINIQPSRDFPVDPANEEGFDNSGESLTMSPALVKKYLAAARRVADHLVLTPSGFTFAPDAAVTETDRDKFCVQQIVSFYQLHEVDYSDYFFAAWKYQHRKNLGKPDASLTDIAQDFLKTKKRVPVLGASQPAVREPMLPSGFSIVKSHLSPKYLATVWSALTEPEGMGPLAELQDEWRKLPDDPSLYGEVIQGCDRMRDLVIKRRKDLESKIEKLHMKGNSDGSQPLVLWWNRQIALQRMSYKGDGKDAGLDTARERFCRVFPNAFSVSSRGHYADPKLGAQVRLLTAGFHLMQGYFRDDIPLCELVLNDAERNELDSLWQNLNFVTLVPIRQYKDFLFFERAEPPRFAGGPEFDFARPENKDVTSPVKLKQMREAYIEKARQSHANDQAIEAIETYFENMSADVRWIEETHQAAEPRHREALARFTERAYRRPLSNPERNELNGFYENLRREGLTHEDAIRDTVASILMSPYFCFRLDLAIPGQSIRPLNDYELASRLSYFLWSSIPDHELLSCAQSGDLHQPAVLIAQAHRMLQDDRVRGLATEFAGHWLDFRRFEEHNGVDRERFSAFTNELRQAMFEEPLRLFIDIARQNRSVLQFLDSEDTFVNPVLAKHYGINLATDGSGKDNFEDDWDRVPNAKDYGRGGLLSMSVFLTRNSPGLRTSPVKRGYWVARRLLGESIPPPPPAVPELPEDETNLGELTLPRLLARHRNHQACAGCHDRFDSIGVAFEGYGPVGERRELDLGGRPVQATALFPDGTERSGIEGIRKYVAQTRRHEFIDHLCRKLLSYALGRSLLLSDKSTLDAMKKKLAQDDYRFQSLIESIIVSTQFLNKRGEELP